jgi:hypothetical protein
LIFVQGKLPKKQRASAKGRAARKDAKFTHKTHALWVDLGRAARSAHAARKPLAASVS